MRPVRSVSILVPTFQGIEFLERLLESLAQQELSVSWDFRAIDSSSSDGTWELLGDWEARFPVPFARERIDPLEFDHGDTRNLLAARSRGDLLVFLTQDAIPIGRDWLAKLVRNFEDPSVAAACCRNVVRPDADLLTRVFNAADPGYDLERRELRLPDSATYERMDSHERRMLYSFNDVASAVRRELWERHPFPRTWFGEDVLMARGLLEAGYTVVYDADAAVEHSHDYDAAETRARARIDGRFSAEWLDRICISSREDARVQVQRQLEADRQALGEAGLEGSQLEAELTRARGLREAVFEGLYEGGLTDARHAPTQMLEDGALNVLYVVHGFPPDTWAGTEIYTYNIAQEMQRRGHRVTILTRVPADERELPDFEVEESEFQGLRVLRMTHRLEHESLRASYQQPRAEEAFARVLDAERPDLVHFQHLIHTSCGLVHVAKERGLPAVVHCHDYWGLCARVQLIRPDGRRCPENMGSGCWLCVKEQGLQHVERLHKLDAVAGPILDGFARELGEAQGPGRGMRRRLHGFIELRERHEVVPEAYAAADLRISPSRFLRAKYLESGKFEPHSFLFSDNGMRTDHVEALQKGRDPQGRVRFGFVGTLVWYKGGEVMVRAMRELADHVGADGARAVLNVYGGFDPEGDPHHAELAQLAEGAPVRFMGRFDNARLSEVYSEIDVLVVPSTWYENSPITIHEAFLTETPVLASDIGGMAEFVRDGVDGLHFAVGDPIDLAAKMQRFLDEPGLLAELSQDFPPVKTIAENAEETEFRYRALCCAARARARRGASV